MKAGHRAPHCRYTVAPAKVLRPPFYMLWAFASSIELMRRMDIGLLVGHESIYSIQALRVLTRTLDRSLCDPDTVNAMDWGPQRREPHSSRNMIRLYLPESWYALYSSFRKAPKTRAAGSGKVR